MLAPNNQGILKYETSVKKRKMNKPKRYDLELNYTTLKKRHLFSLNNSPVREAMIDLNSIPDIRSSAKLICEVKFF